MNCLAFPAAICGEGVDVRAEVIDGREKLAGVGVPGVFKELSSGRNAARRGEELIGTLEADLNKFSDPSAVGAVPDNESKGSESPSFQISFIFSRAFASAALEGAIRPLFDAMTNPTLGPGVTTVDSAVAFAV